MHIKGVSELQGVRMTVKIQITTHTKDYDAYANQIFFTKRLEFLICII